MNRTQETRSAESPQSNGLAELPFSDDDITSSNQEVNDNLLVELPLYDDGPRQDPTFEDNVFRFVLDMYGSMRIIKKLAVEVTRKIQETVCKPMPDLIVSRLVCETDVERIKLFGENIQLFFDGMDSEHKFKSLLKTNNIYFEATKFNIAMETDDSKGYIFQLKRNFKALFESRPDLLLNMLLQYDMYMNSDGKKKD